MALIDRPPASHGAPSTLQSLLSIDELKQRPSRRRRYVLENRALTTLMHEMTVSSDAVLQRLSDAALILCGAHSAGVSLLEGADERPYFHWRATSGEWQPHIGGRVPRDFSPCGAVVD